jgi:hypothetical protein
MAIRIGYQSLWHIPRRDPLPDDEMAARHILVSRLWMVVLLSDRMPRELGFVSSLDLIYGLS